MPKSNTSQLFTDIKSGGKRCELALMDLYDYMKPQILKFISQNNGTKEEAKDILQDAIVTVYTIVRRGDFQEKSTLTTFTYAVAKNLWMNKLKRKKVESKYAQAQIDQPISIDEVPAYYDFERRSIVEQLFGQLGADCKKILTLVYYQNYSMKELVNILHFDNEQVVRNKKYKCMKRLKAMIGDSEEFKKLLKE